MIECRDGKNQVRDLWLELPQRNAIHPFGKWLDCVHPTFLRVADNQRMRNDARKETQAVETVFEGALKEKLIASEPRRAHALRFQSPAVENCGSHGALVRNRLARNKSL